MVNSIERLRKARNLTQQELADRLKVHKNTVINWEKGTNDIKSSDLIRLSSVFDCSIEAIILPDLAR